MVALWRLGEKVGASVIVEHHYEERGDGITFERWRAENGNSAARYDRVRDYSYQRVAHGERRGGILVPYVVLDSRTVDPLPPDTEFVYVGDDDLDYWRVLCDYWRDDFDLTIVEHDVVWRTDVSMAFATCPEPWCVFPYSNHSHEDAEHWANMLGCTRFRKELIAAVPEAVMGIEERHRDWHYTCDGLGNNLRAMGFRHHWHYPAVEHTRMMADANDSR